MPHHEDYEFVRSSHSSGNGECVEVARNISGIVAVRDSKGGSDGPALRFAPSAWASFQADAKSAEWAVR